MTPNGTDFVSCHIQGEIELPSKAQQKEDVAKKLAWRYSFMPAHNFRYSFVTPRSFG